MSVTLYTTHCPQCTVLQAQLDAHHITYSTCEDVQTMREMGITSVPVLDVGGQLLLMKDALSWVKEQV